MRGSFCEHSQCFDLSNFIKTNEKCRFLKCPVCNKKVIDIHKDLFQEWLLNEKLTEEDVKIEIDESLTLKVNETNKKIDLKTELADQLSIGDPIKQSSKTVLAPTKNAVSNPLRNNIDEDKQESGNDSRHRDSDFYKSRDNRSPYDSKGKYSSTRYDKRKDRSDYKYDRGYDNSDDERRKRKYRHKIYRKRRYDRRDSYDLNSQSSSNSDKEGQRDKKYHHTHSSRKSTTKHKSYREKSSALKNSRASPASE